MPEAPNSSGIGRRVVLEHGLVAAVVGVVAVACKRGGVSSLAAQDETSRSERRAIAEMAAGFMKKYDVPGLSTAVGHNGQVVCQQAFGVADRDTHEPLTSSHLFRIASVSKPFTSVAIFTLVEQGRLHLNDRVFGKRGIFGTDYGTPPYKPNIEDITVDHLLTHTCGGWRNDWDDPMFRFPEMNHAELISWTLDHVPLAYRPGEHWAYSNFGYCVLGRVIEKITRQSYRDFVLQTVLAPCGVADMRVAGNTRAQRAPNEVAYYGEGEDPYGMNVSRMDSHGGWIATPNDLVRFLMHVDGSGGPPTLLKPSTIAAMTTPCSIHPGYARGGASTVQATGGTEAFWPARCRLCYELRTASVGLRSPTVRVKMKRTMIWTR